MFQISLTDFAQQLSKQSGKNIQITQTGDNQITAHYLIGVKLDLLSYNDDSLLFRYTLPWGAGVLVKLISSLRSKKFTLNTSNQTIWLHLNAFGAYRKQLNGQKISGVKLQNGILIFETETVQAA